MNIKFNPFNEADYRVRDAFLKAVRFTKVYLSDKSGFWYQRKIKNTLINALHVSVEKDITIWAVDLENKQHFICSKIPYSEKNILSILQYLT